MASVSIKTVAARAGVSFQTASKVLNGKGSVSEQTRQRILEAASQLGYVPNAVARGLVTRSTRTVGAPCARSSTTTKRSRSSELVRPPAPARSQTPRWWHSATSA